MKINFTITLLILLTLTVFADPPTPKKGFRWVLNEKYSDEFNGEYLNTSKWKNYFDGWQGRPPAKFVPSAVRVSDGYMQIKNGVLSSPEGNYTIAGGAVQSQDSEASYGYYECSFKASKIRMSTTFWLSNAKALLDETECTTDRYSQELDISETVGGHDGGFKDQMHSNTHYRHIPCGESKEIFHSKGANKALSSKVYEEFHTYAAWWEDADKVHFYADNEYFSTVEFDKSIDSTSPFDRPMRVNMVTETYNWLEAPSKEDLLNDEINTSYYDWIRAYELVPIDEVVKNEETTNQVLVVNHGFEDNLASWLTWGNNVKITDDKDFVHSGNNAVHVIGAGAPEQVISLKPNTTYTLSAYAKVISGSINLGVKEGADAVVQCQSTEYEKHTIDFTTDQSGKVKIFFYAQTENDEGYADDFSVTEKNKNDIPQETADIYKEEVLFQNPTLEWEVEASYQIPLIYKSDFDGLITLSLRNSNGETIGENQHAVLAGFGYDDFELNINSSIIEGENYTISIVLTDSTGNDIWHSEVKEIQIGEKEQEEPTSIDIGKKKVISIFPNPTENKIQLTATKKGEKYLIMDVLGRKVQTGTYELSGINVSLLQRGNYFLTLENNSITRFIKK